MTDHRLTKGIWGARLALRSAESPVTPTMPSWDHLAQAAYAAYGEMTGGTNYQGKPMPAWDALGEPIQWAWRAACGAVIDAVSDGTIPPGGLSTELSMVSAIAEAVR